MRPCAICGNDVADGARFCASCGAAVAVPPGREARKTVTVLFADVTGSTALGEQLDPESLRRVMARFFETASRCFEEHGATVEKFIGDAVMAVFGVPAAHEDDALRAVQGASELRNSLSRLNADLERDFGVSLQVRMGVNTGEVVVGTRERLATGDAVNVAARLEQSAAPGEILLGAETFRLARDAIEVEAVNELSVKGKAHPITAYRLRRIVEGAPAFQRRFDAPLVGRREELERVHDAFAQAVAHRRCQLFTVLGEPGIGKSRLAREISAQLRGDAVVLSGRCLPYGEGITFWPLREIFASAGAESELDAAFTGDAAEDIFWAVRKSLERRARKRPLALVIEDIHWAEPTLLDLIEYLADWTRDAPFLLLCLARPELIDERPAWGGGRSNAETLRGNDAPAFWCPNAPQKAVECGLRGFGLVLLAERVQRDRHLEDDGPVMTRRRLPRGQPGFVRPGWMPRRTSATRPWFAPTVVALALLGGVLLVVPPATPASANANIGSWGAPFGLPLVAIHATALPNEDGKVLLFSSRGPSIAGSASWLWDAPTGALTDVSVTYSHDMMCAGNTLLSDGTVFVAGGRINAEKTAIFNPTTETWNPGPSMALSRYYPTAIELPDGKVLIFYGRNTTVDSYDPETNTITQLPASANRNNVDLYPRMHVLPDGRLFHAGPERQTSIFDPATSTWSPMGQMTSARAAGATVLLPGLNKVLAIGGNKGAQITNTADIIDFSAATPQWRPTANMHLARQDENAVLLPDGTVLVVGGRGGGTIPKQAELFDPVTETWTLMAAQAAQRAYHSTALLLPDGRVLSAGDGDGLRLTGEIYSPPYLFKGARPTIESATPSSLGYGQAFTIETPDADSITRVALIKPGPTSHGVNFDQRYVDLAFSHGNGEILATSPGNGNLAPPGWYMLFIMNAAGVPSVASWVHVANVGEPPTCTPAAPTVTATPPQAPAVQAGTTVDYTISVKNNDSTSCAASSFELGATAPAGWQSTFNPPSLTIAPGATGTTTLSVTSAPSSPPDAYTIVATATKTGSPSDTASASMTYTVAPSGGGGSGTFTDDFNRTTLGSNWQVLPGSTMTIANNELRNGAGAGLHRAVVPTFAGADQTVTAKFASTSQSSGVPTFGLILRYQNPTNYYLLYRQAGGSSLLRIAKVVNGVTTILGSKSISNPQVNVLFQMTAKATGSTLTLTQGTVTVSATDTTFASGSVGILMGSTGAAISHRADDFSATAQ